MGLALAFVGCVLAVEAYNPEVFKLNWLGVLCGLGTALTHAGYTLSQRKLRNNHPWTTLTWTMVFGTSHPNSRIEYTPYRRGSYLELPNHMLDSPKL